MGDRLGIPSVVGSAFGHFFFPFCRKKKNQSIAPKGSFVRIQFTPNRFFHREHTLSRGLALLSRAAREPRPPQASLASDLSQAHKTHGLTGPTAPPPPAGPCRQSPQSHTLTSPHRPQARKGSVASTCPTSPWIHPRSHVRNNFHQVQGSDLHTSLASHY